MKHPITTRKRQSGSVLFWIIVIPLLLAAILVFAAICFNIYRKKVIIETEPDSRDEKYFGEDYGMTMYLNHNPDFGPGPLDEVDFLPTDSRGIGFADTERNADPAQESSPEPEASEQTVQP